MCRIFEPAGAGLLGDRIFAAMYLSGSTELMADLQAFMHGLDIEFSAPSLCVLRQNNAGTYSYAAMAFCDCFAWRPSDLRISKAIHAGTIFRVVGDITETFQFRNV